MEKPAENQYPIHDLLRKRWSPRAFAPRPIEEAKLMSLFEAARWSPSGGNSQPWFFIVATRPDPAWSEGAGTGNDAYTRFLEILNDGNRVWASSAPVLVLTIAKRERAEGRPNPWAVYDLGQAVGYLTFQGEAMGLAMRQMGGFNAEKARVAFEIPEGYDPITAIAIGYKGHIENLPEDLRLREMQVRTRKPIHEFVFAGRWNEQIRELQMLVHDE